MRVLQILWTLVWGFLGYAVFLPVLSFDYGSGIYWYVLFYFAIMGAIASIEVEDSPREPFIFLGVAGVLLVVWLGIVIIGSWGLLHTEKYRNLIGNVDIEEFTSNVAPISPEQMITVDIGIAYRIGEKVLGEDPGLGSRCELGDFYMQVVGGHLYWIAPLLHSGFWKWQGGDGTPGYVVVNATDERDYRLVKEVHGKPIKIKYQPNAFWGEDLERLLYTSGYSNQGLTDYTFEVNDEWEPYWTVTRYDTKIGFGGKDAIGVVVINPETGKIEEYGIEDAPIWTDRIHPESFVRSQVLDWGDYVHGYFNWKGLDKIHPANESSVVIGSDGHMYYYLGLQSSGADEGTVGFMMINCRTKKSTWIQQSGATEAAARKSAEGAVQEKGYVGSDGITYNIDGHATYEFLLKDNGGLMKMIALVNVYDHNVVGVGIDRLSAIRNYSVKMNSRGNASIGTASELEVIQLSSKISRFNSEVNGGNTIYYLMIDGHDLQFYGTSSISTEFCLSKPGDNVTLSFINSGLKGDVEIRTFDNQNINLVINPIEEKILEQQDSIQNRREEKLKNNLLDRKWEDLTPKEKKALLKK